MYFYKKESSADIPCYKAESEITEEQKNIFGDDKTFDKFIKNEDNFHIYSYRLNTDNNNSVQKCQEEALKHYSNFFLVNDLSYNTTDDEFTYTCTIPKNNIIYRPIQKETTDRSNIFTYLISPVNDFIANVFSNSNSQTTSTLSKTSLKDHLQDKNNDNKCVIYNPSDSVTNEDLNAFGSNDRYIIYKTKFINNDTYKNLQIKRKLAEYNDFNNKIDSSTAIINQAFSYFLNQIHDASKTINGIKASQQDSDQEKENKITGQINNVKTETNTMWNSIFDPNNKDSLVGYYTNLQDDTELLNSANKNYLNFIDALEDEIKKEKKIFNKLKLSKNGNNAKLHDTNLLKQIKIIEIIFLIILPIIVLFFVIKKK